MRRKRLFFSDRSGLDRAKREIYPESDIFNNERPGPIRTVAFAVVTIRIIKDNLNFKKDENDGTIPSEPYL